MIRWCVEWLLLLTLLLDSCILTQGIDLVQGIITCMNNDDCIGANRRCIHNKTSLTGMCGCKPGFVKKSAQSFSCVKGPVMQQCESDYDCREGDVCIVIRAPFLTDRNTLSGRSKNQKICIGTWLVYAADFVEPRTGGGLKHYTDDIFFKRGRRVPQQYVGFVEDMMLVLFLVCILVTLITVHRASCYRQFQDARRNSPLRHILPIGDDQPPPYSERQDSVDGGLAEVATDEGAPKRQSETPPPSYEEALYRNSVQLPRETEARTNLATDELSDLDCLPSYNETRIRIFENMNQPPVSCTTVQQSADCTEHCTLLVPVHQVSVQQDHEISPDSTTTTTSATSQQPPQQQQSGTQPPTSTTPSESASPTQPETTTDGEADDGDMRPSSRADDDNTNSNPPTTITQVEISGGGGPQTCLVGSTSKIDMTGVVCVSTADAPNITENIIVDIIHAADGDCGGHADIISDKPHRQEAVA